MACECVSKSQNNILKKMREDHPDRTYEDVSTWETGFENMTWGGNLYFPYKARYTFTKKNGLSSVTKTHKVNMHATFCPFCGKSLKDESEVEND